MFNYLSFLNLFFKIIWFEIYWLLTKKGFRFNAITQLLRTLLNINIRPQPTRFHNLFKISDRARKKPEAGSEPGSVFSSRPDRIRIRRIGTNPKHCRWGRTTKQWRFNKISNKYFRMPRVRLEVRISNSNTLNFLKAESRV